VIGIKCPSVRLGIKSLDTPLLSTRPKLLHHIPPKMELPTKLVEAALGPAAAYLPELLPSDQEPAWDNSYLNPKNRIENFSRSNVSNWRFFGAEIFESRFFIVPEFAVGEPPLRIDVYLSEDIDLESALCRGLGVDIITATRIASLGSTPLTMHIMHALQWWSLLVPDFEAKYSSMPFGSRILIENLDANVSAMRVHLIPLYEVELQWSSVKRLKDCWNMPDSNLPETIDSEQLQFLGQPHGSISIVTFSERYGSRRFVFKSTVHSIKYLYHELKTLITMDSHRNIIPRPAFLVTKRCRFGGKRGVCGFLLDYFPLGNLQNLLRPECPIRVHFDLETRTRWSVQLASALVHIQKSRTGYFSDLKLDNIVLKEEDGRYDAVLIDFEQRGAWFSWSPPEVNYIMYLGYLASPRKRLDLLEGVSEKYKRLLSSYLPTRHNEQTPSQYRDNNEGHNCAWVALQAEEREKAMVFMFGKLLWCIFEAQATVNSVLFFGAEIFRETNPGHRFPDFRRTPKHVQEIIRKCTIGAPEWSGKKQRFVKIGNKLFPAGRSGENGEPLATSAETQGVAREMWNEQIIEAEHYVANRLSQGPDYEVLINARRRPGIKEVFNSLKEFAGRMGFTEISIYT
jgi:hypothetical protein